ncbi:MAG: hypothetical protein AAFR77_01640 [Cyanobacteria bacterium J06631_2]
MGHQIISLTRSAPEKFFPGEFIEIDLSNRTATDKIATDIASRYEVNRLISNVS